MKNLTYKPIMNYRTALFGIGALGVLAVHSTKYVQWPMLIAKIFGFGGIGVYLFAFLSGIGLFQSMNYRRIKQPRGGTASFTGNAF